MLVKYFVAVLLLKGKNISCIDVLNIYQTSPVLLIADFQTGLAEAGRKWQ